MLDYLRWRGDLIMERVPFNAVDGLILAQLSYLFWETGLAAGERAALGELWERMRGRDYARTVTADSDRVMFELAAHSARFGGLTLGRYVYDLEQEGGKQFAAVTIDLPDNTRFVAYRGTDGTLVGWKENFNMAFSDPVPAQRQAVEYLKDVAAEDGRMLRIGGHSKGGNLAVYAAVFADADVQRRILDVFNFDGPGLSDRIDTGALYGRIADRMHTYVPQSSLVGMLLSHAEDYTVVASDSFGVLQHNPYYWRVMGRDFVRAEARSRDSVYTEGVLHKWLSGVDEAERRTLVNVLFDVFGATDADRFGRDFFLGLIRNPIAVAQTIKNINPESRAVVGRLLGELASAALKGPEDGKGDSEKDRADSRDGRTDGGEGGAAPRTADA